MVISTEVLWSQTQATSKMCVVVAQHGGTAFDLGFYFAKWCIQSSLITKKKPLHIDLIVLWANWSSQHDARSHSSVSVSRRWCEWEQSLGRYTRWRPYKLTSCMTKKNWQKLALYPWTVCLPPPWIVSFLTIKCMQEERYSLTLLHLTKLILLSSKQEFMKTVVTAWNFVTVLWISKYRLSKKIFIAIPYEKFYSQVLTLFARFQWHNLEVAEFNFCLCVCERETSYQTIVETAWFGLLICSFIVELYWRMQKDNVETILILVLWSWMSLGIQSGIRFLHL